MTIGKATQCLQKSVKIKRRKLAFQIISNKPLCKSCQFFLISFAYLESKKPLIFRQCNTDSSGFKKGDKSDGVLALKQLLMLAGYKLDNNGTFGDGTLKAVNALLKKWGYTQNGIAGTKFIKKLSATIK